VITEYRCPISLTCDLGRRAVAKGAHHQIASAARMGEQQLTGPFCIAGVDGGEDRLVLGGIALQPTYVCMESKPTQVLRNLEMQTSEHLTEPLHYSSRLAPCCYWCDSMPYNWAIRRRCTYTSTNTPRAVVGNGATRRRISWKPAVIHERSLSSPTLPFGGVDQSTTWCLLPRPPAIFRIAQNG
jgi:hypothetical protein